MSAVWTKDLRSYVIRINRACTHWLICQMKRSRSHLLAITSLYAADYNSIPLSLRSTQSLLKFSVNSELILGMQRCITETHPKYNMLSLQDGNGNKQLEKLKSAARGQWRIWIRFFVAVRGKLVPCNLSARGVMDHHLLLLDRAGHFVALSLCPWLVV